MTSLLAQIQLREAARPFSPADPTRALGHFQYHGFAEGRERHMALACHDPKRQSPRFKKALAESQSRFRSASRFRPPVKALLALKAGRLDEVLILLTSAWFSLFGGLKAKC